MARAYNSPVDGVQSDIGTQIRTDKYERRALIEAKKDMFFGTLADTSAMPKHMGKKIKRYHYVPLLNDANINDQGIDANGLSVSRKATIVIELPGIVGSINTRMYAVGTGANDAAATTAAEADAVNIFKRYGVFDTDYDTTKAAVIALTPPWGIDDTTNANGNSVPETGNLYGSSKDAGTILDKIPTITEHGGEVNRVGFTRVELEGSLAKYGFYSKYTQESLDFDSDEELQTHIHREMIYGANEITEDLLQIDITNAHGVVYFAGSAMSDDELSGDTGSITEVTYGDLSRLSTELDNNRCPKQTRIITGSRMIDTRVVNGGRIMYIGSELVQTIEQMTDYFGKQAFISVQHYADATTLINGEIGTIGSFRLVVVPEMQHWAGVGDSVGTNAGYRESNGKYDVYPMLVIGDGSFTTIGFQSGKGTKGSKFNIKHSKPGSPESYANDPYGETGFMSIKWYYGFMALRPERIALIKTVARI